MSWSPGHITGHAYRSCIVHNEQNRSGVRVGTKNRETWGSYYSSESKGPPPLSFFLLRLEEPARGGREVVDFAAGLVLVEVALRCFLSIVTLAEGAEGFACNHASRSTVAQDAISAKEVN